MCSIPFGILSCFILFVWFFVHILWYVSCMYLVQKWIKKKKKKRSEMINFRQIKCPHMNYKDVAVTRGLDTTVNLSNIKTYWMKWIPEFCKNKILCDQKVILYGCSYFLLYSFIKWNAWPFNAKLYIFSSILNQKKNTIKII